MRRLSLGNMVIFQYISKAAVHPKIKTFYITCALYPSGDLCDASCKRPRNCFLSVMCPGGSIQKQEASSLGRPLHLPWNQKMLDHMKRRQINGSDKPLLKMVRDMLWPHGVQTRPRRRSCWQKYVNKPAVKTRRAKEVGVEDSKSEQESQAANKSYSETSSNL